MITLIGSIVVVRTNISLCISALVPLYVSRGNQCDDAGKNDADDNFVHGDVLF
jgi:hypothetical protein